MYIVHICICLCVFVFDSPTTKIDVNFQFPLSPFPSTLFSQPIFPSLSIRLSITLFISLFLSFSLNHSFSPCIFLPLFLSLFFSFSISKFTSITLPSLRSLFPHFLGAMMINTWIFFLGGIMMTLAPNVYWLIPARLIVGFASGLASVVVSRCPWLCAVV